MLNFKVDSLLVSKLEDKMDYAIEGLKENMSKAFVQAEGEEITKEGLHRHVNTVEETIVDGEVIFITVSCDIVKVSDSREVLLNDTIEKVTVN